MKNHSPIKRFILRGLKTLPLRAGIRCGRLSIPPREPRALPRVGSISGQTALEAVILWTLVIMVMVVMAVYIKRGTSGRLRQNADEFSGSFYNPRGNTQIDTTLNLAENIYVNSLLTGNQENVDADYGDTELEDEYLQRTWTETSENTTGNETTFLR